MKYIAILLFAFALCSAQPCPNQGDIRDCNNTCVPSTWVGDLRCDNGSPLGSLNCYFFGCDGGDCQPNQCTKTCPGGQIVDCFGKCVSSALIGNGVCNNDTVARLDCAKYSCDGGDCLSSCTPCPAGYIIDCNGNCGQSRNIGDNHCDNGVVNFNCSQYNFDLGDCVRCPSGLIADCNNVCVLPSQYYQSKSNGVCNPRYNCLKFAYDGNDCNTCSGGQVKDCTGSCVSAAVIGNGVCNTNFDCQGYNFDEGDCSGCTNGTIPDCLGNCAPADFYGDAFCDYTSPNFNCSKYQYDNNTCITQSTVTTGSATCPQGYVRDCIGVCQNSQFIGDGQCDDGTFGAVFNCDTFNCDNNDCVCISTSGGRTTGRVTTGRLTSGRLTTGVSLTPATTGMSVQPATTAAAQSNSGNTNNVFTTGEAIGEESSGKKLSSGAVAGIVIGSLIGAVIVFLVIGFLVVSRRPSKYKLRAAEHSSSGKVDLDDHHKGTDLDERR